MTYEKALSFARELALSVGRRAADAEAGRRLHEETIAELVDTGLVRLLTPARFGGHELSFHAYVDSTLEVAKGDASAGWCYSFFVMHSWMLAQFPLPAQQDVWRENPDALITTSFVPAGSVTEAPGGYILNGNWPWSSGVDHSSWCMVGGLLPGDGPPQMALFLLPRSDYEIVDTWFVAGLNASGSKNVLARGVFVPAHRMVRLMDIRDGHGPGTAENTSALSNRPFFTAAGPGFVAPLLGATLAAYGIWCDACRNKFTAFTGEELSSFSHVRIRVAEVEAEIQTARLFLQENLDVVTSGRVIRLEERFRCARNVAYIAKCCVSAMERMYLSSGGSANYLSNPLQRSWRDIHAMAAHAGLSFESAGEHFGRAELGLPPNPRMAFF
jgi:3-hydroxy-9,10-secoandrosta-1,3,5(10)-triene-9,17-dione monooxygenase